MTTTLIQAEWKLNFGFAILAIGAKGQKNLTPRVLKKFNWGHIELDDKNRILVCSTPDRFVNMVDYVVAIHTQYKIPYHMSNDDEGVWLFTCQHYDGFDSIVEKAKAKEDWSLKGSEDGWHLEG